MTAFALLLGAGLLGWLGHSEGSVSASADGYRLTVTYPSVSRAGLSSPWSAEVVHPGGFGGPITLRTTAEYLTIFDLNGIFPDPSSATVENGVLIWEFDPPEGDVFSVTMDTRIEPSVHRGEPATTTLVIDGAPVATVTYRTRLAP